MEGLLLFIYIQLLVYVKWRDLQMKGFGWNAKMTNLL